MWNLRFKVLNKDSIYTLITSNFNVEDYLYPVDYFRKGNKIYTLGIHHLKGKDIEKRKFFNEFKKNKKVREIERNGDRIIALISEEEKFYELLFAQELYHIRPVIIKNGYEEWDVCSFNRKILENLIKEIEKWKDKFLEFELIKLSRVDYGEIYFPKIMPSLPDKQKKAFELALKRGYYNWPRKVNLGNLAREMKVSVSTFHENLRKTESKLMPFLSS